MQAVDGTKIPANAARDRNYDADELQRLLERTEKAIAEMETQNESGEDAPPPRLPEELQQVPDTKAADTEGHESPGAASQSEAG